MFESFSIISKFQDVEVYKICIIILFHTVLVSLDILS